MSLKKDNYIVFAVVSVVLGVSLGYGLFYYYDKRNGPAKPIKLAEKRFRYGLKISNKSNQFVKNAQVYLFSPLSDTSSQKVLKLKSSLAHEMLSDDLDNQTVALKVDIAPYANKYQYVEVLMELSNLARSSTLADAAPYLREDKSLAMHNKQIIDLARQLKGEDAVASARAAFDWIRANIKDAGYMRKNRGAAYAIKNKQGDCTEFSALFVALMRLNKIPARLMSGFVIKGTSRLRAKAYHNWAEFYDGDRWRISDPYKNLFDAKYSSYIAFRILSDSTQGPMPSRQRFGTKDTRIELKLE